MAAFALQRLDHVSLNVSDRQRSLAWYQEVLGLPQTSEPSSDESPAFLGEPGACIALFQSRNAGRAPDSSHVGMRHVALALSRQGFDAARAHLDGLGVPYTPEDHGNAHSLYLVDPDGHRIELTTYEL